MKTLITIYSGDTQEIANFMNSTFSLLGELNCHLGDCNYAILYDGLLTDQQKDIIAETTGNPIMFLEFTSAALAATGQYLTLQIA